MNRVMASYRATGGLVALLCALLLAVVWLHVSLSSRSAGGVALMIYTVAPIGVLAATLTDSLRRGRSTEVGALLLAITPTVLTSAAFSERNGALAVLIACAMVWVARPGWAGSADRRAGRAVVLVLVTSAGALWVASGAVRVGSAPSWATIVATTGARMRMAFAAVGEHRALIPDTVQLVWWCGVGTLAGVAIVSGRLRIASLIPGAMATHVVIGWMVERLRGPVSPVAGAWLMSASIAFVGATVELDRRSDARLGRFLSIAAGGVWMAALTQQVKAATVDANVPGRGWEFWNGWQIYSTDVPPLLLLSMAVVMPIMLVGLIWTLTLPRRTGRSRSRH